MAVVRLNRRDLYLGKHGTPESHESYRRIIAEWLETRSVTMPVSRQSGADIGAADIIINELILAYLGFAKSYYVKDCQPTGELHNVKGVARPLAKLYGGSRVGEFGPIALKAVRQVMIEDDLSRGVINARVDRIRRMFKWGVENQLVTQAFSSHCNPLLRSSAGARKRARPSRCARFRCRTCGQPRATPLPRSGR